MVEYDIEYDIWGGVKSVKPKAEAAAQSPEKPKPAKPVKKAPAVVVKDTEED